jgi:hypothetical protein
MTTPFATAKILLFIALSVGPHDAQKVFVSGSNENYVWTESTTGWTCTQLGFPSSDFTRNPTVSRDFGTAPYADTVPAFLKPVARHDWHRNTAMVFDNGDRVEKHGDHAFFIYNAGGSNEKDYTILYPKQD